MLSLMRTSSSIISRGKAVYSSSGKATFSPRVSEPNSAPGLKQHAELALDAPQLVLLGAADIVAVDQHAAAGRPLQADEVPQQRGLAASGAADDDEPFAAPHLEADVVENRPLLVARHQVLAS